MTRASHPALWEPLPCVAGHGVNGDHAPSGAMDLGRVLVVEDDAALASTLCSALAARASVVSSARSLHEACASLEPAPDFVLMDFALPDGTAENLLARLGQLRPLPVLVAMSGTASAEVAFRIAQWGVRGFLQKPFDLGQLWATVERSASQAPEFTVALRQSVGKVSLSELEARVRGAMIDEALAKAEGSRRGAARLLDISRQLLQHILKKDS